MPVFASIVVNPDVRQAHRADFLRKDYVYLLERFYYYIQAANPVETGIVVLDELERSRSHILYEQMSAYFLRTQKGQERAQTIIPEPLFVHSDLSTGVQIADLVAYLLSWGFRGPRPLTKPGRAELSDLVGTVCRMRHRSRQVDARNREITVWSVAIIEDLVAEE